MKHEFRVTDCHASFWAGYDLVTSTTGPEVTVRIKLLPDGPVRSCQVEAKKDPWKETIEDVWSDRFPCADGGPELRVSVEWDDSDPHHDVRVQWSPHRCGPTLWGLDRIPLVIAHEFGHLLGLLDEYSEPNCKRSPDGTGSIMDEDYGDVEEWHIRRICHPPGTRSVIADVDSIRLHIVEGPSDRPLRSVVGAFDFDPYGPPLLFRDEVAKRVWKGDLREELRGEIIDYARIDDSDRLVSSRNPEEPTKALRVVLELQRRHITLRLHYKLRESENSKWGDFRHIDTRPDIDSEFLERLHGTLVAEMFRIAQ